MVCPKQWIVYLFLVYFHHGLDSNPPKVILVVESVEGFAKTTGSFVCEAWSLILFSHVSPCGS